MERPHGRRARIRRADVLGVVAAVLLLAALAAVPRAGAVFTATSSDVGNVATAADLAAPTGFSVTQTCSATAIVFRGATPNTSVGTGSLTLTTPPGTQAGDILVAHVTNRYDGSAGITPPSAAWTLIGARTTRGSGASGVTAAVYWKPATAAEPGTATFTLGGGTPDMAGALAAYGGVDPTTPVNAVTVTTGSSTSTPLPSLSPTVPGVLLVDVITKENEAQSAPTGSTERWRVLSPSTGTNQGATGADKAVAATGPTGSRTAPGTTNGNWVAHTFALQPAPRTPSASLIWTPSPTSGATGYSLQRVVSGSTTRTWSEAPLSKNASTDGPLVNGTTYTYRIHTYSGSWVSPTVTASLTPAC